MYLIQNLLYCFYIYTSIIGIYTGYILGSEYMNMKRRGRSESGYPNQKITIIFALQFYWLQDSAGSMFQALISPALPTKSAKFAHAAKCEIYELRGVGLILFKKYYRLVKKIFFSVLPARENQLSFSAVCRHFLAVVRKSECV